MMNEQMGVSFKKNNEYDISYIQKNLVLGSYVYCYARKTDPLKKKDLILRARINNKTLSNNNIVGLTLTLHDDDSGFNLHALKRMGKYAEENELFMHDQYTQTIHLMTFIRNIGAKFTPLFYMNVVRSKFVYIKDLEFYL